MASVALNPSLHTFASESQPQKKLNELALYDPLSSKATNEKWRRIWNVAAAVTAVAMIAIAATTFVLTSLWYPAQVPLATLLIFLSMDTSMKAINYPLGRAKQYAKGAEFDSDILSIMKKCDPKEIAEAKKSSPLKGKQLKVLVAQKKYELFRVKSFLDQFESTVADSVKKKGKMTVDKVDFSDPKKKQEFFSMQLERTKLDDYLREAALCHVRASYIHHLIKHPTDTKSIEKQVTFITIPAIPRLYSQIHGDKRADVCLKTKDFMMSPKEILETDPDELSEKLFAKRELLTKEKQ